MQGQGSGRRVLHFAVTGALLGGSAMAGCTGKTELIDNPEKLHVNPGPDDKAPDSGPKHTNMAPQPEPPEPDRINVGPEDDKPSLPPDHVKQPEPPVVMVNPGVETEPLPDPVGTKVNPGPETEPPKPEPIVEPKPLPEKHVNTGPVRD